MIFCGHCRRNFEPKGTEAYCSGWCHMVGRAEAKYQKPRKKPDGPRRLKVDMAWLKREVAMSNYEYAQRQLGGPYTCDACGYQTRTLYFYRYGTHTLLLCPASLRKIDPEHYRAMVESVRESELWKARKRWEAEHATDWMEVKSRSGANLYSKGRAAKGAASQKPPETLKTAPGGAEDLQDE